MTSINSIQNQTPITKTDSEQNEQQGKKPTLNDMNSLYNSWFNTPIHPFPAHAMQYHVQKRTEALEQYIKDNNLDVDVKNLETFFSHVKDTTYGHSGLAGQNTKDKMFSNYIENGYENKKMQLKKHLLNVQDNAGQEQSNINKDSALENYLFGLEKKDLSSPQ